MRLSFRKKFYLTTLAIYVLVLIAGWFLISAVIKERVASVFREQLQGHVAGTVQSWARLFLPQDAFQLGDQSETTKLFSMLSDTLKTRELVRIKVWDRNGRIIFSEDPTIIGRAFPENEEFQEALITGEVVGEITEPTKPEHVSEKGYRQLVEIYVPIKLGGLQPAGVIETYYKIDALNELVETTTRRVTAVFLGTLALLYAIIILSFNFMVGRRFKFIRNKLGQIHATHEIGKVRFTDDVEEIERTLKEMVDHR